MEVEVKESSKKAERPFPKLMVSKRNKTTIALFCTPTEGTIIQAVFKQHPVGYHSFGFASECFEDFEGSITLSND